MVNVAKKISEAVGLTKPARRFDPQTHPRAVETAQAIVAADAKLEAARKALADADSAHTAAKLELRATRLKAVEGAAKPGDVEGARRAVAEAEDRLEGARDVENALKSRIVGANEAHRRALAEAEAEAAEAIRQALRENVRKTVALVEGENGMAALAAERLALAKEAETLSAWGSVGATKHGYFAGCGESGAHVCKPGASGAGLVNGVFLKDPFRQGGSAWLEWLEAARHAGISE